MTSDSVLVELEGVGKRYTKYDDVPTLVGRAMRLRSNRGPHKGRSQLWAVRGVDLRVSRGETLGILGQNGSGKSTLLGMMAGVTAPTEGVVRVRGRVAPLIAVGVGFHPELTGRENIYVNGTILGLSVGEINDRLDQIIDFAEIPDFIDTPVKFYSSGMFVRLGFSVAVAADPDLLLVDEVLAVGDLAFQLKCYDRLRELQDRGATIVTVSHNLTAIRNLCSRVMVMDHGKPVFLGNTAEGVSTFHTLLSSRAHGRGVTDDLGGDIEVSPLRVLRADGETSGQFSAGDEIVVETRIRALAAVHDAIVAIAVTSQSGVLVYTESTPVREPISLQAGETSCLIRCRAQLPSGSYTIQVTVRWGRLQDQPTVVGTSPSAFYVTGRPGVGGVADLHASFAVSSVAQQHVERSVAGDAPAISESSSTE